MGGVDMRPEERQYCQLVVFIAHHLRESGYRDIYLQEQFPMKLTEEHIRSITNILYMISQ